MKQAGERRAVFIGKTPLLANTPVPILRQCLGHLHSEAMDLEILRVLIPGEELRSPLRHSRPDRHDVEGGVVDVRTLRGTVEVGDAQPGILRLTREGKPGALRRSRFVRPDDQIVAVAVRREVPVNEFRHQQIVCLCLGQLVTELRTDPFLELGIALTGLRPILPLIAKQRRLVDVIRNGIDGNAADDPRAEEWRLIYRVVGADRGGALRYHSRLHRLVGTRSRRQGWSRQPGRLRSPFSGDDVRHGV